MPDKLLILSQNDFPIAAYTDPVLAAAHKAQLEEHTRNSEKSWMIYFPLREVPLNPETPLTL